jgi:1-acyl-sn-glycerol-3-phosphate acyltransferase
LKRSPGEPKRPARTLVRVARILTGLYFPTFHHIEHHGAEHLPLSGPLVVTSNHPTYWDPWLVGMGTRRFVHWMAWDEIFNWPVIGRAVTLYEAFPLDLEKPKVSTFKRAHEVLEKGGALGIFPEGGRTSGDHGELDPLKPGVARLALILKAPVLCVSIKGARKAWPKKRAYPLPGPKITVTYHPPIDPVRFLPDLAKREREKALLEKLEATIKSAL